MVMTNVTAKSVSVSEEIEKVLNFRKRRNEMQYNRYSQ
jgi:hypothetical protein